MINSLVKNESPKPVEKQNYNSRKVYACFRKLLQEEHGNSGYFLDRIKFGSSNNGRVELIAPSPSMARIFKTILNDKILELWKKAEVRGGFDSRVTEVVIGNSRQKDVKNAIVRQMNSGKLDYRNRENRRQKPVEFLQENYSNELKSGDITLSDLRKSDESLWRALRNWAHAGGHDLESVIPRGRTEPGRPREELGFDPLSLDPNNPRDALLIRGLRARESSRQASAAYRQRKSAPK